MSVLAGFAQDAVAASRLICLSHLRWNFVTQRPQHLLRRAAREHKVYFVEEPILCSRDFPTLSQSRTPEGITVLTPHLPEATTPSQAVRLQRDLLDSYFTMRAADRTILWYYTPAALAFTDEIEADLVVYDCMDELSAFRGASPDLRAFEKKLLAKADLVFTGGHTLYEAKRHLHPSVHAFPSSIDVAHFDQARTGGADPEDQAGLQRPRLGFFGVIDERMDLDLVAALAQKRPDWSLIMLGPVVKIEPSSLPRAANIHWLGPKQYEELPDYLRFWDVGFMPFALNESTRFISPTKTPEFLAAGCPVVSTRIADVVRPYGERGLVEIADDADGFATAAERLMAAPREAFLRRVDRHLSGMSWDMTWAGMSGLLKRARALPDASVLPVGAGMARGVRV